MVANVHGDEAWHSFCEAKVTVWEERVRIMLAHLDRKLQKTMAMLSDYQTEVAQVVRACPKQGNSILRTALVKNLNTQAVLLSIIDFRRRALVEDVASQLYNVLLEMCTLNLLDVAALLGCVATSPYVTFRVMQLINSTVEQRQEWLLKEFDERKCWVNKLVAELNSTYEVLMPSPLRRSASCTMSRTSSHTSHGSADSCNSQTAAPDHRSALGSSSARPYAASPGVPGSASSAQPIEQLQDLLNQCTYQTPSYVVGPYRSQTMAPHLPTPLPSMPASAETTTQVSADAASCARPGASGPGQVQDGDTADVCGCAPRIVALFRELDAKEAATAAAQGSRLKAAASRAAPDLQLSPVPEVAAGWSSSRQPSLQRASMA